MHKYKEYLNYLRSKKWKKIRKEMLEKFPFCNKCGTKEKLTVHHLNYKNLGKETSMDLLVLCKKHHDNVHRYNINPFVHSLS